MAISGAWERIWIQIPLAMEARARTMKKPAMGRLKKISQEPWEISSDCCRDVSSIWARTVASTI